MNNTQIIGTDEQGTQHEVEVTEGYANPSLPGYEEWADEIEARWVAEQEFNDELREVEARAR
jgi:hypothetical protein